MRNALIALVLAVFGLILPEAQAPDYPPPGDWARNAAAEVGMDAAKLTDTVVARGSGGNIIFISPSHDLLVVWRWSAQSTEGFRRVVTAMTN